MSRWIKKTETWEVHKRIDRVLAETTTPKAPTISLFGFFGPVHGRGENTCVPPHYHELITRCLRGMWCRVNPFDRETQKRGTYSEIVIFRSVRQ